MKKELKFFSFAPISLVVGLRAKKSAHPFRARKGRLTFGRKIREGVLPRISAALGEFVIPIASKGTQPVQGGQASQFRRFEDGKRERSPDPKSEAPPGQEQESGPAEQKLATVIPIKPDSESLNENGLASTLVQLLALFKEHQATLIRALGLRSYAAAERRQKKALSAKRGAILDRKAE